MIKNLPAITVSVIVFNEEKRIRQVLSSIFKQNYPKDRLEVIVVDDKSTDRTVEIAKQFSVKIVVSGESDPEISALKALWASKGEFIIFLGADMIFRTHNCLRQLVKPLMENPDIVQAATRWYRHSRESLISQYLSLDPLQRDPIYKFFSISPKEVIVEEKDGYFVTQYTPDKILPMNAGLFRVSAMKNLYRGQKKWMDIDQFCYLVDQGYTKFAYVPKAGFYHFHADSLRHLLKKRIRNLNEIYLPNVEKRRYTWFSLKTTKGWLKVVSWVILANLFFPLFFVSLYKVLREKTWLYLMEAPLALILTDYILFHFLKNPKGRMYIRESLESLKKVKK